MYKQEANVNRTRTRDFKHMATRFSNFQDTGLCGSLKGCAKRQARFERSGIGVCAFDSQSSESIVIILLLLVTYICCGLRAKYFVLSFLFLFLIRKLVLVSWSEFLDTEGPSKIVAYSQILRGRCQPREF